MNRRRTYSHLCRVPAPRLRDAGVSVRQVPLRFAGYVEIVLYWDEQNRLLTVTDNEWFSYYQYDAGGDRTYKLPYLKTYSNRSGRRSVYWAPEHSTLYASPYLVATPKGYTKHYYAESERVASRTGAGMDSVNLFLSNLAAYRESSVSLNSPVWQESWTTEEDFLAKYDTIEWQLDHVVYECLWTYPNVVFDSLNILYSYANLSPYQHENEPDCYWYHPDHLGSSSWITYSDGKAVQHLHYLPWGEDFVDQRSTSWNAMYTFSAKEKDTETGYSYFGSRYYNSDLSIWLSVDPMASKYPSLSAYTYCANNPVKLVDPDGEEVWLNGDENSKAAAFKSMQEGTHLLLTMGKDGRITAEGDPISDADYLLLDAINDNSVKVNIECNRNGDAGEYHGTTYDKINSTATSTNLVNMFEMAELEKDAPVGSGIIHEVTEGYYAGLIAIATRKSIRAASRHREEITITGANIKITGDFIPDYPMDYKKYIRAHYRATPAPNEMTPAQKNNFRSPSILYRIDQLQKKLQIL